MPQSFRKKYEKRELEILNYINEECGGNKYGFKVMEHFEAKDDIAWRKEIDYIAQKFDFRFCERERCSIAEAFRPPDVQLEIEYAGMPFLIRAEARLRAKIARKEKRIEELKRQVLLGEMAWGVEGDYEPSDLRI